MKRTEKTTRLTLGCTVGYNIFWSVFISEKNLKENISKETKKKIMLLFTYFKRKMVVEAFTTIFSSSENNTKVLALNLVKSQLHENTP